MTKEDRKDRLQHILLNADTWVPAITLSKMLGVSTRTVRSYISQLGDEFTILSSQNGYRLAGKSKAASSKNNAGSSSMAPGDDMQSRAATIITELLSRDQPFSLYDAADILCISESSVSNGVVPRIRELTADFGLTLDTRGFQFQIEGEERDKRRLLRYLVTQHSYGYFTSASTLSQMFPDFDIASITAELVRICQGSDLFLNEYALNNLLVHLLVIVVRMKTNHELAQSDDLIDASQLIQQLRLHSQILHCGNEIAHELEHTYDIHISEADFQQILLLIALSSDQYDYEELSPKTMTQLVDKRFLGLIDNAAQLTAKHYGLENFDEDFLMQLTLHSYNAYQRAKYGVSCINPIGSQIKQSHPLVYDMAVFFCHQLDDKLGIRLDEEEVAFIAFHFGAYLANHIDEESRIRCVIIAENYHSYSGRLTAAISDAFSDKLQIGPTFSINSYLQQQPETDLVITTVPLPKDQATRSILISPLVGRRDIRLIEQEAELIQQEREREKARHFLRNLLHEELFVRNVYLDSVDEYLDYLGELCLSDGYVTRDFIDDVKLRERTSSTAFVEGLAIPHSINQFAERSFVCVLHNDEPIPWGRNDINVIMLFGLSKEDIHKLGQTFDIIVERFNSTDGMRRVLGSDSFDQFVTALLG